MRMVFLLFLIPSQLWAQNEAPVMTATCQCELWNSDGILIQAQGYQDPFLMAPGLSQKNYTTGEYELKKQGRVSMYMDSTADKNCVKSENGDMTASCFNAAWYARKRAESACFKMGVSEDGMGRLKGQCNYELQGEYLNVPENLIHSTFL